jgi:adenosylcobinamide amidohydrolase
MVVLERPWLTFDLGGPARVLSWAPHRPGFVSADAITWREVRNADLPREFDVAAWMPAEFAANDASNHVGFLTSRDVRAYMSRQAVVGDVTARCVATTGLSNAEAIGTRLDRSGKDWGTINVAVHVSVGLQDVALIEMLSLAAAARTAAVLSVAHDLPTGRATGTGTDCIAVAAPEGGALFAGMHTEIGEAVGRAVFEAVAQGARDWKAFVQRGGVV